MEEALLLDPPTLKRQGSRKEHMKWGDISARARLVQRTAEFDPQAQPMHLRGAASLPQAPNIQHHSLFRKTRRELMTSRHSNRHAPRNTKERKVRSKIR
jgi:hypothetical protein